MIVELSVGCSKALLLAAAVGLGVAACEKSRERPTGLNVPVPATQVRVVKPENREFLFSDSSAVIEVEAIGLLQAVGFHIIRSTPVIDTLVSGRREFTPPVEIAEEQFIVRLPALVSGTTLEIRAVAENLIGERAVSAPVSVSVINCDSEPFRCG